MSVRGACKRVMAVVTAVMLLLCAVPLSAAAAYENTHVNTGDQALDLVAVARTQIGYVEGSNNYNKYGAAYNHANDAWCGFFVAWCARQADIPTAVIPDSGIASDFGKIGTYHARESGYIPQPGDLVLYGSREEAYHVSIVEKYTASTKTAMVIDGNWSDQVSNHPAEMDNTEVAGFVTPKYTSKITKLTAFNMEVPSVVVKGNAFPTVGYICSPRNITSVSATIVDAAGKTVVSNKATPNAQEYDLSKLSAGMKLTSASAGTYSYVVTATDTKETKRWTYVFTVVDKATVSIKDVVVPSTLKKGNTFSISGRIICNEPILRVFAGIYTQAGTFKTGGGAQPNATSCDISSVDNYVSFGSLSVGKYVVKISMRSANLNETWEYPFEVTTGETFSLQGVEYPTKLAVGEAFSVTGKVVCSAKISAVTINILDEEGNRASTATAYPETLSYNLEALDSAVPFSKMPRGIYTYRIGVRSGNVRYEWQYPFAVGDILSGDLDGSQKVDTQDALLLYSYVNGSKKLTAAQKMRIGTDTHDTMTSLRLYNYTSGSVSKYP